MTSWQGYEREQMSEERLVRAVNVLAEIVEKHGPAYGPLHESLQEELATFRRLQQSLESAAEPQVRERPRKIA